MRRNSGLTSDILKAAAAMMVFLLHGRIFLPAADQMTGCLGWITYFPAWGGGMALFNFVGIWDRYGFFSEKVSNNRAGWKNPDKKNHSVLSWKAA